jgi:PhnB protein
MDNLSLIEQLDQAVEALIANPDAPLPRLDNEVAALVRLAAELRELPREAFKESLKDDLKRSAMSAKMQTVTERSGREESADKAKPMRGGFHTVTPYLAVREANELIDFVKRAFGAEGAIHGIGSEGGLHAEFKLGDSMVMIGGGEQWRGTPMPTSLHLYVEDVDAVYERALAAGATSIGEPVDQFYGDRESGVQDVAGNKWYIATHKGGHHIPEGLRSVTTFLPTRGAGDAIEFMKGAFGAEEISRYESPDGVIRHATIRIGDSMIELGEAHGQSQPMPTMFFLNVDDVDAWYSRAVSAGATSKSEPADQSYGSRVAGVTDPSGNVWYLATHIQDSPSLEATEADTEVIKPIREGFHTVTPYLSVMEAFELIDFIKEAFGAEELFRTSQSPGAIHAELRIGDSMLMIGGGKEKLTPPMPTALHLYVEDADAVYQRALAAGATSTVEPMDEPHMGDRLAAVTDLSGNQWVICTNKATGGVIEGLRSLTPYLHPDGAAGMIEFLKQAFGAEEVFLAQSPEGIVFHAKIKVGDSIIEMGDPRGKYPSMPTMFFLYVDDVDAWYARAMAAEGAVSMEEPADQPYGHRVGTVRDPFDNLWYIAKPHQ